MSLQRSSGESRRLIILGTSYAALILIAVLAWAVWNVHVGVIAVIPLLFIAYFTRLPFALFTAACSGILLGFLDRDAIPGIATLRVSPISDGVMLAIALCAVVLVAERLRSSTLQNAVLLESLRQANARAQRDSLTGIPNRAYFLERLQTSVRAMSAREHVGVLFADLDNFKAVNDGSGHTIGDRVLVLAAERLRHAVRANDLLARMGGDEFAILIGNLHDKSEADALARKIELQFTNPFHVGEQVFSVGVTLGVSIAPQDGLDPHSLLRTADARMYRRKEAKTTARVTIGST